MVALTPSLGEDIDGKMAINLSDSIQTITSPVQSIIGGDLVLIGRWKKMLSWTRQHCRTANTEKAALSILDRVSARVL